MTNTNEKRTLTESEMTGCLRCSYCLTAPTFSIFTSSLTNEDLIQLQCDVHEGLIAVGSTLTEAVENWNLFIGFMKSIEYRKAA